MSKKIQIDPDSPRLEWDMWWAIAAHLCINTGTIAHGSRCSKPKQRKHGRDPCSRVLMNGLCSSSVSLSMVLFADAKTEFPSVSTLTEELMRNLPTLSFLSSKDYVYNQCILYISRIKRRSEIPSIPALTDIFNTM